MIAIIHFLIAQKLVGMFFCQFLGFVSKVDYDFCFYVLIGLAVLLYDFCVTSKPIILALYLAVMKGAKYL